MFENLAQGPGFFWILLLALALDALIGDPAGLWRRYPHPAVLLGRLVGTLDRSLNRDGESDGRRRLMGVLALGLLLAIVGAIGWGLHWSLNELPFGWMLEALLLSILLAQRSLYIHVRAVAEGLERDGLAGGRAAVRHIVGRDPESLDEPGVARAAIESLAENYSDGVAAPLFWASGLGLPGMLGYKAANTADSMIGHRSARHRAFGWAAARFDDLINLIPARLAGLTIALASGGALPQALRAMLRDAPHHRSPNAGWQEAAMAGALGIALAGPRRYGGVVVEDRWMGEGGRRDCNAADIRRALALYRRACLLQAAVIAALAVFADSLF